MVLMLAFDFNQLLRSLCNFRKSEETWNFSKLNKITDTKVEYIEYKDDGAYFC